MAGSRAVGFGLFWLRLVLGGVLLTHGLFRLVPKLGAQPGEIVIAKGILSSQAGQMVFGGAELFIGALLILGLFVRFALLPVLAYFAAQLVAKVKAGDPLFPQKGASCEEYVFLLGLALGLLLTGPGKFSLQRIFRPPEAGG